MRFPHLLACALATLLAACGGSDDPVVAPASTTVSGDIVKGPVGGATVTFKRPDGSVIGSTATDANGHYSLASGYSGDLVIEASGGEYTDEATGAITSLATPMRAVLTASGGSVTGMVTPLTTMVYTWAFPSGTAVSTSRFSTVAELTGTALQATDWSTFSTAFSSAYVLANGGTLSLNSCSFVGNVGTLSATLGITTPITMPVPYTVTHTYN